MHISKIAIKNFRNFKEFSVDLGKNAVIVGENKVGKSNLLHALRLLLDPTISDDGRMLYQEDFWYHLPSPLQKTDFIHISADITDFDGNRDHIAFLEKFLVSKGKPLVARLNYLYRPLPTLTNRPSKRAHYEYLLYGGNDAKNEYDYRTIKRFPCVVQEALRDAVDDLQSWRHSPLRPLLEDAVSRIDEETLEEIASEVEGATKQVSSNTEIEALSDSINKKLVDMVGPDQALDMKLQFAPTDPEGLPRALRLYIDSGKRSISFASLGSSNMVYLTLKLLELARLVNNKERLFTFLAIEEPEAHLHPQLQRLIYRDVLRSREHQPDSTEIKGIDEQQTSVLLTTHSPHIVSVSPLKSLVLLRKEENTTNGYSTANISLSEQQVRDLEHYLDVTRGEILFARNVILVEGTAETFLLPWLAKQLNIDFDKHGITVCCISGVDFIPYVRFLKALNFVNYVAITDYDPGSLKDGTSFSAGLRRVKAMLSEYLDNDDLAKMDDDEIKAEGERLGFFVNSSTLEYELWGSGLHGEMAETLKEFGGKQKGARAEQWCQAPDQVDRTLLLKDIEDIGKGRFAQRLATKLTSSCCPEYLRKAIEYAAR